MVTLRTSATASLAPDADPAQAARVLRQFRQVFNAVKTHFQQVEKAAGLGGAQLWALSVVAAQPEIGVNQLAKAMDVRQSTASNLVRALAERGLLTAAREGDDRRAVQLRLTKEGRAVLKRAPGPFTGVLPEALAALDTGTLGRMESDLARLIRLLEVDPAAARIPLGGTG